MQQNKSTKPFEVGQVVQLAIAAPRETKFINVEITSVNRDVHDEGWSFAYVSEAGKIGCAVIRDKGGRVALVR